MMQHEMNLKSNQGGPLEDNADEHKYVIFRLGDELYGARLLEVREVVEVLPTKVVPNTVPSFLGVCNLRGQIIGVIDLRKRFDIAAAHPERPVLLVFDTDSGAIATTVDQIVAVSQIPPSDVERKPNIISSIPVRHIVGIGKLEERMITLVDLKSILSTDELANVHETKTAIRAA